MTIDMKKNVSRAPKEKLGSISALTKQLLTRAVKNKHWIPVIALVSLVGKAQFLHLANIYLRKMNDMVKSAAS
jgi:hypothetical protein